VESLARRPPGRGDKVHAARVLEQAMRDVGAKTGWILNQADGTDILRPGLARRSFAATPEWLPYDLARDLAGSVKGLPRDLATNPKYLEGFGR
jgi:hypothetical protein